MDQLVALIEARANSPNFDEHGIWIAPIKSIDGVRVDVYLIKHTNWILRIVAQDIHYEDEPIVIFMRALKNETMRENVEEMVALLHRLRFDRVKTELSLQTWTSDIIALFKSDTVSVGQECCVCHDVCRTKTPCNHRLCAVCISGLKQNEEKEYSCPLCREEFMTLTP